MQLKSGEQRLCNLVLQFVRFQAVQAKDAGTYSKNYLSSGGMIFHPRVSNSARSWRRPPLLVAGTHTPSPARAQIFEYTASISVDGLRNSAIYSSFRFFRFHQTEGVEIEKLFIQYL